MRRILYSSTFALFVASVWISSITARGAEIQDPLIADPPHYTLEIDNQWTRVFREHMGPRDTMIMHKHPLPGAVIVMLTDRHNRLTAPDGTFREFKNDAGYMMWSNASTHESENLDPINFEALQIEPRAPKVAVTPAPAEKLDAVVIDPQHYKVEFENEYARVIRIHVGPHEKLPMHKHPDTKAVTAYLTDFNMKVTDASGNTNMATAKARQVRFVEPMGAHQEENVSDAPVEFLRVELKQAR